MGYTEKQIVERIIDFATNNINKLYSDEESIWYEGESIDTHKRYSEIISELLINNYIEKSDNSYYIKGIDKDTRLNYFDTKRNNKLGKGEDKLQRDIYYQRNNEYNTVQKNTNLYQNNEFIWYEFSGFPSKGKGIDLISYNKKDDILSIYELKKYGNDSDNLLRAILEIQTYYQRTRFEKFVNDWDKYGKKNVGKELLNEKITINNIRKVILIPENTLAYKNYMDESLINVHNLLNLFNIEVIILK